MKHFIKIYLTVLIGLVNHIAYGQATNGAAANNNYNGNHFLGWANNNGVNPLFFRTNGLNRMRLAGNTTALISGYTLQDVSGNLGIGYTGSAVGSTTWFNTNNPLSLLQLKGKNGNFIQTAGYRPWMQSGLTFTENQDFSFVASGEM